MSNSAWAIATLAMLALGVFFIANHRPRDQAAALTIIDETERPAGEAERK